MTPTEWQTYLELASGLKELSKTSLWLSYDAEADTAYINFQNPPVEADDSDLTDDDVLLRYGEDGEVIGLTILHVSQR